MNGILAGASRRALSSVETSIEGRDSEAAISRACEGMANVVFGAAGANRAPSRGVPAPMPISLSRTPPTYG